MQLNWGSTFWNFLFRFYFSFTLCCLLPLDYVLLEIILSWLLFFQFPIFFRIDRARQICKIICICPFSSFYHFEGHLFREAIPVIYIWACVNASDDHVCAYLNPSNNMNPLITSNNPFGKESKIFQMMLNIDADNIPQISPINLKRNLQRLKMRKKLHFLQQQYITCPY